MEKKMTRKDKFVALMSNYALSADDRAFVEAEIAKIDTKAENKKMTPTQMENEKIKGQILAVLLDAGVAMTVGQVQSALDGDFSNQKISTLMHQLVKAGRLKNFVDKKVSYFTIERGE